MNEIRVMRYGQRNGRGCDTARRSRSIALAPRFFRWISGQQQAAAQQQRRGRSKRRRSAARFEPPPWRTLLRRRVRPRQDSRHRRQVSPQQRLRHAGLLHERGSQCRRSVAARAVGLIAARQALIRITVALIGEVIASGPDLCRRTARIAAAVEARCGRRPFRRERARAPRRR